MNIKRISSEIDLAQFVNKLVRVIEPRHGKIIQSCESIVVALDNIIRKTLNDLPILTVIDFHLDLDLLRLSLSFSS